MEWETNKAPNTNKTHLQKENSYDLVQYTRIWRLLWRLRVNNIKSYEILLVVINFVSSILCSSFCLIYPPLTTLDCVANLVTYSSCFCRLNLFSYLLISFILLHTLLYYILIDCQIIQILLLLLFLIVNVRNKDSNKMADKSRAIVFTFVDVWCCFERVPSMELLFRTLSLAKMRLLVGTAAQQKAKN